MSLGSLAGEPAGAAAEIRLRGLVKSFHGADGPIRAVRGIDVDISAGETVALLGPNGAGKSTTIDMLLGLLAPDEGSVSVFGSQPAEAVARGAVGGMLQTGQLIRDLTVRELVGMMASLYPDPMDVEEALSLNRQDRERIYLSRVNRRRSYGRPVTIEGCPLARPDGNYSAARRRCHQDLPPTPHENRNVLTQKRFASRPERYQDYAVPRYWEQARGARARSWCPLARYWPWFAMPHMRGGHRGRRWLAGPNSPPRSTGGGVRLH